MNTSLRILIDESIEDDLADEIASMSAFHAEYIRKIQNLKGSSDKKVMEYARVENRIVVTVDNDYNSSNFPICTHPGIIRVAAKSRHHATILQMIQRFARCGHRDEAKHAIAHLTEDYCNIEREKEKIVQYRYK